MSRRDWRLFGSIERHASSAPRETVLRARTLRRRRKYFFSLQRDAVTLASAASEAWCAFGPKGGEAFAIVGRARDRALRGRLCAHDLVQGEALIEDAVNDGLG